MKKLLSIAVALGIGGVAFSGVTSVGNRALENIDSGRVSQVTSEVINDSIYGFMDAIRGNGVDLSSMTGGFSDIISSIFSSSSHQKTIIRSSKVNAFTQDSSSNHVEGFGN